MFNIHHWFELFSDVKEDDEHHFIAEVQNGDTLRGLARRLSPDHDEDRFHELVDANPSETWDADYTLQPGEKLRIPKSWAEG